MPLRPADLLREQYRIMGELGAGGRVYRAFDEATNSDCVVQEIELGGPDAARQFELTATRLMGLHHPRLARVLAHFVIEQTGYLIVEFINGQSLSQKLANTGRPMLEADVLSWARDVLDALVYLSRRVPPVVHGQLKPGALRLTADGHVTLVNYAPTAALNPREDLYALGATLYRLLTTQTPEHDFAPVRQLNPIVAAHRAEAVERAISPQPEARFNTPAEFAASLLATPAVEPRSGPSGPKPIKDWRARAWPIVGSGALLIGLGLAVWAVWRNSSPLVSLGQPSSTPVPVVATQPSATPNISPSATLIPPTITLASPTTLPVSTSTVAPSPTLVGERRGQIAFVSERLGAPQIFLMNAEGADQRALTNQPTGACQPVWSPDGAQLLFISPCARKAATYRDAAVYRMDADGSNVTLLLQLEGGVFDVAWAEGGLAFVSFVSTRPQIFFAAADGSGVLPLSVPSASDRQPAWSPDGQRLAFLNTSRVDRPNLYWMNGDGSYEGTSPLQVTRDLNSSQPAWSPDGRWVAFVADGHVYVVEWDKLGFDAQRLTDMRPNDEPAWSPDGQWLAFETSRDDALSSDIYRMVPDGTGPERLTTDPAKDYQPAWQP